MNAMAVLTLARLPVMLMAALLHEDVSTMQPSTAYLFTPGVVASSTSMTRTIGRASKSEDGQPVLVAEHPWEVSLIFGHSVITVGAEIWLYYNTWAAIAGSFVCLAKSSDGGLSFDKPSGLGHVWQLEREQYRPRSDPHAWESGGSRRSFCGQPSRCAGGRTIQIDIGAPGQCWDGSVGQRRRLELAAPRADDAPELVRRHTSGGLLGHHHAGVSRIRPRTRWCTAEHRASA